MNKEDRNLLLRDLCSRLPYGVKMNHIADDEHYPTTLIGIAKDMITLEGIDGYECVDVEHYKPYLFPLSSMTEEQKNEYEYALTYHDYTKGGWVIAKSFNDEYVIPYWFVDWCNKNHLDFRGLIPKDLAIDCTNLNIY